MPAPHRSVRMPFLPPNQQCQSTEGIILHCVKKSDILILNDTSAYYLYSSSNLFTISCCFVLFCCLTLTVLFALLWIKEEITERMAAEFQGDLTHESILQVLDCNNELVGDENTLTASGMALLLFIVY